MGLFNKGSKWCVKRACRLSEYGPVIKEGTIFEVVGSPDFTSRIIPVRSNLIYDFVTPSDERTKSRHQTGSILHDYVYRNVERIGISENPFLYVVKFKELWRFYTGNKRDPWGTHVGEARFYENEKHAIKALLRSTNEWRLTGHFSGTLEIAIFDTTTGDISGVYPISDAVHALLRYMQKSYRLDRSTLMELGSRALQFREETKLYMGHVKGWQHILFFTEGSARKLHRGVFMGGSSDVYVFFAGDQEALIETKLRAPFQITTLEF